MGRSEYRGALAPLRSGITRGATRLAAGRGAHASPDPFLATGGHVGSTLGAGARGSAAGTRPFRSSVGDGAAELRPLSGGHESRERSIPGGGGGHGTRWSGRARNPGLGLGSELTSCRLSAPSGPQFPLIGEAQTKCAAFPAVDSPGRSDRRCGTAAETEPTLRESVDTRRFQEMTWDDYQQRRHDQDTSFQLLSVGSKRGSRAGCGLERPLPGRNPRSGPAAPPRGAELTHAGLELFPSLELWK